MTEVAIVPEKALDGVASLHPNLVREDWMEARFTRIFATILNDEAEVLEMRRETRESIANGSWEAEFDQRVDRWTAQFTHIIEHTFHPNQVLSAQVLATFLALKNKLLTEVKQRLMQSPNNCPNELEIEEMVTSAARKLVRTMMQHEFSHGKARRRSTEKFDEEAIQHIRTQIVDTHRVMIASRRTSTPTGGSTISKSEIIDRLIESVSMNSVHKDWLDESKEARVHARARLEAGAAYEHTVWMDYDGAKRPEMFMYSSYADAVWKDIEQMQTSTRDELLGDRDTWKDYWRKPSRLWQRVREGTGTQPVLNEQQYADALSAYERFTQIAAVAHAMTLQMQDPKLEDELKVWLELTMLELKERRGAALRKLKEYKNLCVKTINERYKTNIGVGLLSRRISFVPRLDHRSIEALTAYYRQIDEGDNATSARAKLSAAQKRDLEQLDRILYQIKDLNELSHYTRCANEQGECQQNGHRDAIGQIILAMCQGADDILHLKRYLGEKGERLDEIPLTPLYEELTTTSPEAVTQNLERLWEACGSVAKKRSPELPPEALRAEQVKVFHKHHREVFFAGSDLSKETGQLAALVRLQGCLKAIHAFNRDHATEVMAKLGSGESLFRQGGFYDATYKKSAFRGKVADSRYDSQHPLYKKHHDDVLAKLQKKGFSVEDAEAEYQRRVEEYKETITFLQDVSGDDWQEKSKRVGQGYLRLMRLFPFFKFTSQSASNDGLLQMSEKQLADYISEMDSLREANREKWLSDECLPELPEALVMAAKREEEVYKRFVGDVEHDARKAFGSYGELVQEMAKMLTALRDRGASRPKDNSYLFAELEKIIVAGIEARAIGSNSASRLLFPLGLVGKGAALDHVATLSSDEERQEVLRYFDVRGILTEMKTYSLLKDSIFRALESFPEFAGLLASIEQEWQLLAQHKPLLQNALWDQEVQADFFLPGKDTPENRQRIWSAAAPDLRDHLDDAFTERRHDYLLEHEQQAFVETMVRESLGFSLIQGKVYEMLVNLKEYWVDQGGKDTFLKVFDADFQKRYAVLDLERLLSKALEVRVGRLHAMIESHEYTSFMLQKYNKISNDVVIELIEQQSIALQEYARMAEAHRKTAAGEDLQRLTKAVGVSAGAA